jgi:hypothetical protein
MTTPSVEDDRTQLADYLSHHGPSHGAALRAELGWTMSRFWDAVYGNADGWFTITSDGWALAEQARQQEASVSST